MSAVKPLGWWFAPWRWKRESIEMALLVSTCVFVGGWIRSQTQYDTIIIASLGWVLDLSSEQGNMGAIAINNAPKNLGVKFGWNSHPIDKLHPLKRLKVPYAIDVTGFHCGASVSTGTMYSAYCFVSYWLVVGALIASYGVLLLSKPRKDSAPSAEKKIPAKSITTRYFGFPKKLANLQAAMPAMAAGVTDRLWSLEDLHG